MDSLIKVWDALKVTLHWNRVMIATIALMGALTPLGQIPADKVCALNNSWQGALWCGLLFLGVAGSIGEFADDWHMDFCTDGPLNPADPSKREQLKCCGSLKSWRRRCAYLLRLLSNLVIIGVYMVAFTFLYMREPSCFVYTRGSLPPNSNPAASTTPNVVPYVSSPGGVVQLTNNLSWALGFSIGIMVFVLVIRILSIASPDRATQNEDVLIAHASVQAALTAAQDDQDLVLESAMWVSKNYLGRGNLACIMAKRALDAAYTVVKDWNNDFESCIAIWTAYDMAFKALDKLRKMHTQLKAKPPLDAASSLKVNPIQRKVLLIIEEYCATTIHLARAQIHILKCALRTVNGVSVHLKKAKAHSKALNLDDIVNSLEEVAKLVALQ
jgi:hypothetical protein